MVTIILFVLITVSSSSTRIKGDGVLRLCASSLSSITLFVDLFREIVVSMSFLDEDTIFDNNSISSCDTLPFDDFDDSDDDATCCDDDGIGDDFNDDDAATIGCKDGNDIDGDDDEATF